MTAPIPTPPFGPPGYDRPPLPPPGTGPNAETGWEPPPAVFQRPAAPVAGPRTPDGLKVLAILVSVVKAIPLVLFLIVLIVAAGLSSEFDDLGEFGDALDQALVAVFLVGLFFLAVGGILLFVQVRGVVRGRLLSVVVVASMMTALDAVIFLAVIFDDDSDASSVVVLALTLAAQAAVLVWTLQVRAAERSR
ncbi:MAG: hypothetical protein AAGA93_00465 [Actinomycetota bacterium]